jgi:hypothetical protein
MTKFESSPMLVAGGMPTLLQVSGFRCISTTMSISSGFFAQQSKRALGRLLGTAP